MEVADIIAQVESSNRPFAQRFEKLQYKLSAPELVARVSSINDCSLDTADVYLAMSHGLFQIMGYELYGDKIAYDRPLWYFMTLRAEQVTVFNKFLKLDRLDTVTAQQLKYLVITRAMFARLYNGRGNVDAYSAQIEKAISYLESRQP